MRIYSTKATDTYLDPEYEVAVVRDLVIFEPQDEWKDTGLLDSNGHKLMYKDSRHSLGFITPKDD